MLVRIAKAVDRHLYVHLCPDDPESVSVLPRLLRDLRRSRLLTLDELAEQASVPREELCRLERGDRGPTGHETLRRLADFYGIPRRRLEELSGGAPGMPEGIREQVARYSRWSGRPAELTPEEQASLDRVLTALREADAD
jgi:transcriptional regulator with XRE-family HTH domain